MKSLIVNSLGGKRKFVFLPCTDTVANTFATDFLDGEFDVYSRESEAGTDSGITAANKVSVYGKDTTTFKSMTLNFTAKASKSPTEIENTLKGKTFNGVKFDTVSVSVIPLQLA